MWFSLGLLALAISASLCAGAGHSGSGQGDNGSGPEDEELDLGDIEITTTGEGRALCGLPGVVINVGLPQELSPALNVNEDGLVALLRGALKDAGINVLSVPDEDDDEVPPPQLELSIDILSDEDEHFVSMDLSLLQPCFLPRDTGILLLDANTWSTGVIAVLGDQPEEELYDQVMEMAGSFCEAWRAANTANDDGDFTFDANS
ncbi:MAG: hypothetical protein KGJ62_10890 [Armatimonadetes bacterium]|nr:hypothetical protein [Armatimonadota bacterium]MDE2207683.1 hypothetical protein [Armatimonadota bacterium]